MLVVTNPVIARAAKLVVTGALGCTRYSGCADQPTRKLSTIESRIALTV